MTASTRKVLVYSRLSPAGIKIAVKPGLSKTQVKKNHIVCKVICAGLNPVDAKYLVGDKLPQFVDDIVGRRSVEGLGVGFDFSGVVNFTKEVVFTVYARVYSSLLSLTRAHWLIFLEKIFVYIVVYKRLRFSAL
mmetsp:Transcript_14753/g.19249  ORF Transcript_14753/g.19249 Transcript_14753/m.19249 type:complete len:134 (-) Transcript_14753:689-1090(-)